MKRLALFLLTLPLIGWVMTSCSDDDSLPDVDINFTYTNGTVVESEVYVVKPDTLYVDRITVTAKNTSHKAVIAGYVTYYLDGMMPGYIASPDEPLAIATTDLPVGQHLLTVTMTIAEEKCSLASAVVGVKVNVVENASDIPSAGGGESNSMPVPYTLK